MEDNPAAALGRLRWRGKSKADRKAAMDALREAMMDPARPDADELAKKRHERAKKAAAASAKARSKAARRKKIKKSRKS